MAGLLSFVPSLIGSALSLASQGLGMKMASDAAKGANKKLDAMTRENKAWYDKNYNEDPLQRVSSQRVLSQLSDMLRQRNKTAAGRAAVLGGSSEAVAAQGDQNASMMADAMGRIAAQNEARKDDIEQQYRERKNAIEQEKMNVENLRLHLSSILPSGSARQLQLDGYEAMAQRLGAPGAARRAAKGMVSLLRP